MYTMAAIRAQPCAKVIDIFDMYNALEKKVKDVAK